MSIYMLRKLAIVTALFIMGWIIVSGFTPAVREWLLNVRYAPGEIVVRRLCQLYQTEQYERLGDEAARWRDDARLETYRPQILYIEWVAERRRDKTKSADSVKSEFLARYPEHSLAADMHLSDAMTLLAARDYEAAEKTLAMIEEKFPDAKVAVKAREMRTKLRERGKQEK